MLWIIIGGIIGFTAGALGGTLLAPQPSEQILGEITDRLRRVRAEAIELGNRPAEPRAQPPNTAETQPPSSGRRRTRGRRRGRRRRRR